MHKIAYHSQKGGIGMDNQFFKNIEKKTGVSMNDVMQLANSLQNANFKDENTVRSVIKRVAKLANKRVPKEMEDKIVESIVSGKEKMDFNTIAKMMNSKK
jgi:hypothetical protein